MEVVILPETLQAGLEAYSECIRRDMDVENLVIAIYLAMRAVELIRCMRESDTVH